VLQFPSRKGGWGRFPKKNVLLLKRVQN